MPRAAKARGISHVGPDGHSMHSIAERPLSYGVSSGLSSHLGGIRSFRKYDWTCLEELLSYYFHA